MGIMEILQIEISKVSEVGLIGTFDAQLIKLSLFILPKMIT